jgi:hypothetical protein
MPESVDLSSGSRLPIEWSFARRPIGARSQSASGPSNAHLLRKQRALELPRTASLRQNYGWKLVNNMPKVQITTKRARNPTDPEAIPAPPSLVQVRQPPPTGHARSVTDLARYV